MNDMSAQLEQAKAHIRVGFFAALFSLAMTFIITVLGATGTLDIGVGTDWYMMVDVVLIAVLAFGIWKRSRTATTAMFIYFAASKLIALYSGQYGGIIVGLLLLFFYGRAMIASYRYHTLIGKGAGQADVF